VRRKRNTHEAYAAALPYSTGDAGRDGLAALVIVGKHQLDVAQAAAGQGAQDGGSEGSTAAALIAMPGTSGLPR